MGSGDAGNANLTYESCRIATSSDEEEGRICIRDGIIFALLVRQTGDIPSEQGWYLQCGFGPCDQEGLVFASLEKAGTWIDRRVKEKWKRAGP